MTLKREIKDAYLEGGNSIYVKTHSNAVYVDENETETLTQRLDDVKGKIDNNTSQLNKKANKGDLIYTRPEWQESWNEEDATQAIQDAINTNLPVKLSEFKYYISDTIILKNRTTLYGSGMFSTLIKLKDGIYKNIIETEDENVTKLDIHDFAVVGNLNPGETQGTYMGLFIKGNFNRDNGIDPRHNIYNIYITAINGDGFYISGRGESHIDNVQVQWVKGNGIYIKTWDSWYTNLSSGEADGTGNGIVVAGANNKITNIKSWYTNIGLVVSGTRNIIKGGIQDCKYGIKLTGNNNKLDLLIDTVGSAGGNVKVDDGTVLVLGNNCTGNMVDAQVTDRCEYFDQTGTIMYLTDLQSKIYNNKINIHFNKLKGSIFKTTTNLDNLYDTNTFNIYGTDISDNRLGYYTGNKYSGQVTNINGSLTTKRNNLFKRNNLVQIIVNLGGSFTEGMVLGKISKEYYPIAYLEKYCPCLDENNNVIGYACLNISNTNGNLQLWNIPSGAKSINFQEEYVSLT